MKYIIINLTEQSLSLFSGEDLLLRFLVSTAANGGGEQNGSYQTPRGKHIIRAKIGGQRPMNTVFRGRRPTGEIYSPDLAERYPQRDWILTRILWLSGCEIGRNRLGQVDTMRRYIYIHGTPDETELGKVGSIGCIRMANRDVVQLFDAVVAGMPVTIEE